MKKEKKSKTGGLFKKHRKDYNVMKSNFADPPS